MKNKSILLCLVAFLMTFLVFTGVISAQNVVDVEGMDNEQLTTLLLQILDKLQQKEEPEAEAQVTPALTATPVPTAEPETIEEVIQITIYDNKKLIIEALPGYMFIQPTEPAKSEPEKNDSDSDSSIDYSQPCDVDPATGRSIGWCYFNDAWHCGCG